MATLPMPRMLQVSTRSSAPLNADTSGSSPGSQVQRPAFITTASLATFAGGSAAITATWKVAIAAFGWDGRMFPAVVAAILGVFFFLKAIEGENLSAADMLGAFIVAIVNACVLWAAAVGLDASVV